MIYCIKMSVVLKNRCCDGKNKPNTEQTMCMTKNAMYTESCELE